MAAAAGVQTHPQAHHHHPQRPPPLGPFHANRNHSEPERWICIYPAYINSLKSLSEGRQIKKSLCVPNPNFREIHEVLNAAELNPLGENKSYPRERSKEFEFRGRIRIQLRNDDGTPKNEQFPTRESVLKYLCEMIPQLKSRASKQQGQESQISQGTQGKKGKKKK